MSTLCRHRKNNGCIRIPTEKESANTAIEAVVDKRGINLLGDSSGKALFHKGEHRIKLELNHYPYKKIYAVKESTNIH